MHVGRSLGIGGRGRVANGDGGTRSLGVSGTGGSGDHSLGGLSRCGGLGMELIGMIDGSVVDEADAARDKYHSDKHCRDYHRSG